MTENEYQHYLLYWEIPLLESYIEKLEEAFENELSNTFIERSLLNVLIRSYPQCILVLKEVICLVKNGYPDGALARSRRIYENMIIATYLNKHKTDADFQKVIDRYFDDHHIRANYGKRKVYLNANQTDKARECYETINKLVKKHTTSKNINKKRDEIISNNYWWAKNSPMSFGKLSECFDDEYAKLLYLRACYSIHAGAYGDVALLGRPHSDEARLYSGRTYNGAATSMQLAVSSFCNITEIVFENFGVESPISNQEFIKLIQTYIQNGYEEMNV